MPNLFRHLKGLNKIPKQVRDDSIADFSGNGWGGRTRALEWRYQKLLPYHLATPQKSHLLWATLTAVFPKCKGISATMCGGGGGAEKMLSREIKGR